MKKDAATSPALIAIEPAPTTWLAPEKTMVPFAETFPLLTGKTTEPPLGTPVTVAFRVTEDVFIVGAALTTAAGRLVVH